MADKLLYLAKALSRTTKKDYENYVVNAIWNRVGNPDLVPVTQQCVKAADGHYFFIDLYFPQLNVGIECDEKHHDNQQQQDKEREMSIFDVLSSVSGEERYESAYNLKKMSTSENRYICIHIKIGNGSFEDFENQIDECVDFIKRKIEGCDLSNGWSSIESDYCYEYYKDREFIRADDGICFPYNCYVYNAIFGQNYNGSVGNGGQRIKDTEYYTWFPKTVKVGNRQEKWENRISRDGTTMWEYSEEWKNAPEKKKEKEKEINVKKVTFPQVKTITGNMYRFAGVFVGKGFNSDGEFVYERIDDKFKIIR